MPPDPNVKKSKTGWPLLLRDVKIQISCCVTASPKSLLHDSEPSIQADYVDVYGPNGTIIAEGVPKRDNTMSLGYGGKVFYALHFRREVVCDMEYGTDGSRFMPREYYKVMDYNPKVRIVYWYQNESFEQLAEIPIQLFVISNGKIENTEYQRFESNPVTIEINKDVLKSINRIKKSLRWSHLKSFLESSKSDVWS